MPIIARPLELKNANWVRQAFFAPKRFGGAAQQVSGSFTSADMKYYDTTPGGNKSINPPPQFTVNSDIRRASLAAESKGMGPYYSEAIDDNANRISLRFGNPEYNSLSRFLSGYYDRGLGQLVHTGEVKDGIFSSYTIGKALGTLYTLPLQAYFGATYLMTRVSTALTGRPYSKFYYMEPAMPLYWTAVNTLMNQLGVDMGLVHGYQASSLQGTEGKANPSEGISSDDIRRLNQILPDVIRSDSASVVDVKSIASRAQRLAIKYRETLDSIARDTSLSPEQYRDRVRATLKAHSLGKKPGPMDGLQGYLTAYSNSPTGRGVGAKDVVPSEDDLEASQTSTENDTIRLEEPGIKDFLMAELQEGSAFVTFTTDNPGPVGESFTNSVKDCGLQGQINQASSAARDTFVSFAGGNIGDGIIGETVEAAMGAVKGLLAGVADSVGFGGLATLGGAAFVDIPQVWDDATADLPTASYKIRLSTPYGNKMSIYLNIYLPLMCLLAGALPRSTGKSSYGPPFLCSLHDQGRNDIKLGMIDSLQIERGTANIGFTNDALPTAIDVTISVKNLNSIMHMPLSDSLTDTLTSFSFFDEDTAMSDYLSSLAGMDLYDQFYMAPRLKLAWAKTEATWDSFLSPSYFAQYAASTVPGGIVSGLMRSSDNLRSI